MLNFYIQHKPKIEFNYINIIIHIIYNGYSKKHRR
jgi:hypothetical protein